MKYAGVSISITSITDIIAFAAGGSTSIPGLSSFCIYCSVGLIAIFLHTVTFFLASLVLKQQHVEDSRDGCFPCYRHAEWKPSEEIGRVTAARVFQVSGSVLLTPPVRTLVICVTLGVLGVGVWGCTEVKQSFSAKDILNKDSYLREWFDLREEHFTDDTATAAIFIEDVTEHDLTKIHELLTRLKKKKEIISDVNFWTGEFIKYVNLELNDDDTKLPERKLSRKFFPGEADSVPVLSGWISVPIPVHL
jgi:Niemann-Pick C1 protein